MSCLNYQSKRGFTLLELLIAMAIVSILATIAIPSYRNYIIKSEIKTAQADLVALSAAIENRFQRRLRYPTAALASTSDVNGEFSTWMASTKKFTFSYAYASGEYTITAKGSTDVGGCVLTLKGDNTTTATDCISTKSSWI